MKISSRLWTCVGAAAAAACVGLGAPAPAAAEDGPFGLDLAGSFGENGFDRRRYVPPVSLFILNETPFITTEVRPIYAHHEIPADFITNGGDIDVFAVQGRLALTDRLGIIATTDGWADIDFDQTLEDTDGFLDIAVGLKYALISDPAAGEILTVGLRYTAPVGDIESNGLDLTGRGDGYVNPFVTGAKTWSRLQAQASAGAQIALSSKNTSTAHVSGHLNYRLLPRLFPFVEANALIPIDGGDQLPNGAGALSHVTGAEFLDLGSPEPDEIITVGGGFRYRLTDNAVLGAGVEANVAERENTAFDWRFTTDLILHF